MFFLLLTAYGLLLAKVWGANPPRVQVHGDWLYVDGEPFLVKGVGYSPYRPGQVPWDTRLDPALVEQDFQRIAAAGFNTIRTWSPLSPELVALAERHGLFVLQGIWVEQQANYTSPEFLEAMTTVLERETARIKGRRNVLAMLVGNELSPEQVFRSTVPEVETVLAKAAAIVKAGDPEALVSYANWPSLAMLDPSIWDVIGFNLYPYEPASIAQVFGFRGYVEHLKRTVSRGKPLIITEVGLSVSPARGARVGYGGWSPEAQRLEMVKLWDELFQAGAQGGVVFEWNDEWWKHMEGAGDQRTHEREDPEEWFGLIEFASPEDRVGAPRPLYEALRTYNQAILVSPVSDEWYREWMPVSVYAVEGVARVRIRLDRGKWQDAAKVNGHWWKLRMSLSPKTKRGAHRLMMEAFDRSRHRLVRRERAILIGPEPSPVHLTLESDKGAYEVDDVIIEARYAITVRHAEGGHPVAEAPVSLTIVEPQSKAELTQTRRTDANGRIEGTYLIREPGIVMLSAATPRDGARSERRLGAETFFVVRRQAQTVLAHIPSLWEARLPQPVTQALAHEQPAFALSDAGTERIVNYERYGVFHDAGTPRYRYEVSDWAGLSEAVGEGIYPNERTLARDPAYLEAVRQGRLEGSPWDFLFGQPPQLAFFKWAQTDEDAGVKQFYTALTLERAGLWLHAVKAYRAVLVHFPTSIGWTAFDPPTPWYVGMVARDRIEAILRLHPELGMRLDGAGISVQQGFDNDVTNDAFVVAPGTLMNVAPSAVNPPTEPLASHPVRRALGRGRVRLVQFDNRHWQLTVDGKPWVIRGLTYKPTAVGETPDEASVQDWMTADRNGNGRLDVLETFVDENRNGVRDPHEETVGDAALIHAMGVNTLRLYHTDHGLDAAKAVLRQWYEQDGIMVMMGDFVGMYTVGSGAKWEDGTDYRDPAQRQRMVEGVQRMVRAFKDEPYLLMWVLGNENNYGGVHGIIGGVGNAGRYPKEYYAFVNELAEWIHREDPNHPVAIGNGDLLFLDVIAQAAPAIDVFGANAYRGWHGFGRTFFEAVQQWLDKPVVITEYGCPAYQRGQASDVAERDQALYHLGSWVDVADNMAGRGVGNALGGVVFEWLDEWWKGGQPPAFSPRVQETTPNWAGPFPGGWNFEEWFGLAGQGDGTLSPFLRRPRLSYQMYRQLWMEGPHTRDTTQGAHRE